MNVSVKPGQPHYSFFAPSFYRPDSPVTIPNQLLDLIGQYLIDSPAPIPAKRLRLLRFHHADESPFPLLR